MDGPFLRPVGPHYPSSLKATLNVSITNQVLSLDQGPHFFVWQAWPKAARLLGFMKKRYGSKKECMIRTIWKLRNASSGEEYLLLPTLANLVLHCCAHKWFGSPHTCLELESNRLSLDCRWLHTNNGRTIALRSAWTESIPTSCRFCTPRYDHVLQPPSIIECWFVCEKRVRQ